MSRRLNSAFRDGADDPFLGEEDDPTGVQARPYEAQHLSPSQSESGISAAVNFNSENPWSQYGVIDPALLTPGTHHHLSSQTSTPSPEV